jgi:hypothetical protein
MVTKISQNFCFSLVQSANFLVVCYQINMRISWCNTNPIECACKLMVCVCLKCLESLETRDRALSTLLSPHPPARAHKIYTHAAAAGWSTKELLLQIYRLRAHIQTRKIISAPGFLGLQVTTKYKSPSGAPRFSERAQIKCLHQNRIPELYIILCINAFVCFLIWAGMRVDFRAVRFLERSSASRLNNTNVSD